MSGKATESDILAWIEGELPEGRLRAVEAAFVADPSLRAWASSMRGDRVALQEWAARAEASAPGGLAESALERVERAALLGPSEAEALAVGSERETPAAIHRIRRYATAAAIVLAVSVIGVTGVRLGPDAWRGGGALETVKVDPSRAIQLLDDEPVSDPHTDLKDAIALAGRDEPEEPGFDGTVFDERQVATLLMESESPALVEPDRVGRSRPMGVAGDLASLLETALGREAITGGPVIAVSPEEAIGSMDRLVVRVRADDPAGLSLAMQSRCGAPESPAIGWSLIYDGSGPDSMIAGMVCTVRLPGEAAGLGWLLAALEEVGASKVTLTLREDDRGSIGADKGGPIDAARALWWGEPISSWAWNARVGVLIEPSDGSGAK